ncbi:MAG: anthranilate synthase component I family protein [Acidimicrobiia bacterium]
MLDSADVALLGGWRAEELEELTSDVSALDRSGRWVVVLPFEGRPVCARFARWTPWPLGAVSAPAVAVPARSWRSSLDRAGFGKGVRHVREAIAAGDVYQVNLCRRLSAPVPDGFGVTAFGQALLAAHPAPHGAVVSLPSAGLAVASASPERFLRRSGRVVESRPIKGTATVAGGLTAKDRAENVMIVDLVRNDLGRVCEYGSVEVPDLWEVERHPGLVHLVSTVRGRLRGGVGWAELVAAAFPPGSVTGAPKLAALEVIAALEPVSRSVYTGAVGWVDADRAQADLNVAIRTFWVEDGELHLGVGGGITWDSTPDGEWEETELKARRLLQVISG